MRAHALALAAVVSFIPVAAKAADNAERGFALFSADGQYFAFEQFGIQDGSGFPYSTIAVVDLDRDRWIDGTPVTVRPETEEATLARTRADAAVRVKPVLDRLHIDTPGETLASNPATEIVPDRKTLTFAPYYQGIGLDSATHRLPQSARYTLSLTDIPFPLREPCYGEEKAQYGFVLTVRDHDTKASKEAYRDRTIPASRYCPLGYDLADIFVFRKFGAPERYVALIGVYTPGFEGLDRRLIAVPIALP